MKWKTRTIASSLETIMKNCQNFWILNCTISWCTCQRPLSIIFIWQLHVTSNSWLINYVTTISFISIKKIWCSKYPKKDAIYQDTLKLTRWDHSGRIPSSSMLIFMIIFFWTMVPSKVKSITRFGVISNQNSWWLMVSNSLIILILFVFRALQLSHFLRGYLI